MSPCDRPVARLLCVLLSGLLATAAMAAPTNQPLDPERPDAPAVAHEVLRHGAGGLSLRLDVGQIATETVTRADRSWTALSLDDGALDGRPGESALPVWSTLVAVPHGAVLSVRGSASLEVRLNDLDLAPQLRDDGGLDATDLVGKAATRRPELVELGTPARMGGITVVPVTIRPVSYDAAARTATVAGRVDVELNWDGDWGAVRRVGASMDDLVSGAVVNWPEVRDLVIDPDGNYGTWVMILPGGSTFYNLVEPLVEWRRRQGYNVVVNDLDSIGGSNYAVLSYLQSIYDTVDPPLEFVTLVGDGNGTVYVPTWREGVSGLSGEGDHYYTLLDGDDQLPDVHIGRLSCRNTTELVNIIAKIVNYETNPPRDEPDWFTRGLAVGDPVDSGITTIFCARWLADQLYGIGFDRVDQIVGGEFATAMYNSLNEGRSVFGYRGFYGVSGFVEGHILSLNNGGKLPFALFPTCESSSWLLATTARSEAFLRNAHGGAIGAIGTATPGTHTRYNNCLFYGTMDGLLNSGEFRQGSALSRGKLELFRNYGVGEPHIVEIWSTWNTLMGDPATDIWLAVPSELDVLHPVAMPAGATALPVTVTSGGVPVAGAHVAAVSGDSWRVVARTDADGRTLLPVAPDVPGDILLTVTGHNLLPYQGGVTVADQDHWVALEAISLDGDGVANPAEVLDATFTLRNLGEQPVSGLTLSVTSESPWLTVLDGAQSLGSLSAGASVACIPVQIAVDLRAPDGVSACLRLTASGDQGLWVSQAALAMVGPDLQAAGTYFGGPMEPGASGDLMVTLTNHGTLPSVGGPAVLRSRSIWVSIEDSTGTYNGLAVGETGNNATDPFHVTFAAEMVAGASVPLTLVVENADGVEQRIDLLVAVGERTITDPTGGDAYGYYAFDDGDVGYAETRPFEWLEIDPTRGGPGQSVGLGDTFYERDDSEVMPLPFPFSYYGQQYSELTICSNGWVSFGATDEVFWRNWSIPSSGSPGAMVAVFWDDLLQWQDNTVYHWYDEAEHRYFVQWSRMDNALGGQQTCQVILLDPAHYPTRSGDGIIVCQYLELDDNDLSRGYATMGIQSPDRSDGVCYSYYDHQAPGAAEPHPGMAITYQPVGRREARTCDVTPASLALTLAQGTREELTLHILNDGEPGDPLVFDILQIDPDLFDGAERSMVGSTAEITESEYLPGESLTLNLTIYNGSNDNEWIEGFTVDLPTGVTLTGGTDLVGTDGHTLNWLGNSGDGVPAAWLGGGAQMLYPEASATATFTIEVDYGVGDLDLPWVIQGDGYAGEPHSVAGTFPLTCSGNLLNLISPDGGEVWAIGEERAVVWEHSEDITLIDLELSRDDGATWEVMGSGLPATDLEFPWAVMGPVSGQVRARVTAVNNPLVQDTSAATFYIQNDLSWVELTPPTGEVMAGTTMTVNVAVDATGLDLGQHQQLLVLVNNAGPDVVVPLTLDVEDGSLPSDLPRATALAQNSPNPFNPSTSIGFALAQSGHVDLAVYDLSGRRVAQLVNGPQRAGQHAVIWTGQDSAGRQLPSGTYLYRLVTDDEMLTRKLVLVK